MSDHTLSSDVGAGHTKGLVPIFLERGELSIIHTCTVGWVRTFPHINSDLPGRVWKEGFQSWETEAFLRACAAVTAVDHLHLPNAFKEQEPLHMHTGRLAAGTRRTGVWGSWLQR